MMDNYRDFLERQIRDAEKTIENSSFLLKDIIESLDTSVDDVNTWRKALEKYTRDSDSPYHAQPFSNPLDALLVGRAAMKEAEPEPKREQPKRAELRQMPPKFSKRGAVRAFLETQNEGLDVSEIYNRLPQNEYPEPITKDNLYRILPSLYSRGEVERDGRGKYIATRPENRPSNGNGIMEELRNL